VGEIESDSSGGKTARASRSFKRTQGIERW
jgi:hypothetical protein